MHNRNLILFGAFTSLLSIFIVNGMLVLFALPVLLLSCSLLLYVQRKSAANAVLINEKLALQRSLANISTAKRGNKSSTNAIRNAMTELEEGSKAKGFLKKLFNLVNMSHYQKDLEKEFEEVFQSLKNEYEKENELDSSIEVSSKLLENNILAKRENDYGKLNKYLMTSTVLSCIVPSLATLAFVGYSIIYYSQFSVLVYFSVILAALPFLYWASRIKVNEIYDPLATARDISLVGAEKSNMKEDSIMLEALIEKLIDHYSESNNLAGSIDKTRTIYPKLMLALKNANYGACDYRDYSTEERSLLKIIAYGLKGNDVRSDLLNLKRTVSFENKRRLQSLGTFNNTTSVNTIGSCVFFPAFAGIGLGIVKFAAGMGNGLAAVNPSAMLIGFAGYIGLVNVAELGTSKRSMLGAALLYVLGLSVLLISASFSSNFVQL